ncbi:hypothetical protein F5Y16DRAFT_158406 [Xylariaceae sp. FL0255]|nr:hypothetical protein F5Y16DRAFT_158406 [Xylariaceae sp. FL0255]
MDAVSTYSFLTCGWHALQAIPLIIWPHAIISLLTPDTQTTSNAYTVGAIEHYLARSYGLALLFLGLVTLTLTGSLSDPSSSSSSPPSSPNATPATLLLTTIHHALTAWSAWQRYSVTGETGFLLGFLGSAVGASFGTWCLLFGGQKARISRRTGADKRTSGFPFRNAEADRKKGR